MRERRFRGPSFCMGLSIGADPQAKDAKSDCPWRLTGQYWTNKIIDDVGGSTGEILLEFVGRKLKDGTFSQRTMTTAS